MINIRRQEVGEYVQVGYGMRTRAVASIMMLALTGSVLNDCETERSGGAGGSGGEAPPAAPRDQQPDEEPRTSERLQCKGITYTNNGDNATWSPRLEGAQPEGKKLWIEGRVTMWQLSSKEGYRYDTKSTGALSITDKDSEVSGVTMTVKWEGGADECSPWHQSDKLGMPAEGGNAEDISSIALVPHDLPSLGRLTTLATLIQ